MTRRPSNSSAALDRASGRSPRHGVPDVLSALLVACLVPDAVERVLVLVPRGERIEGLPGTGWKPEHARNVSIRPGDTSHPVGVAFEGGEPAVVRVTERAGGVDPGRYLLFPLHGDRGRLFGAILIGPEERELERFDRTLALLAALGPALERVAAELDPAGVADHLRRERDLLRSALDALPDPVFVTNAFNDVLLHNQRAAALFSSAADDSDGRRRAVEVNNLFFSSFLTQAAIGDGDSLSRDLNLVNPTDGSDILIEALVTPGPGTLGGEERKVSVLRDVTDLKRATTELESQFKRMRHVEAKSRRERDRLNMILENVGGPILVTDESSNIILLNREAERLFAASPAEDDALDPTHASRTNGMKFSSFIANFSISPDVTRVARFTLTDPETGLDFPAEAISGKVLNPRAEVEVIVSIIHDRTEVVENRRMAGELAQVNERLSERVKVATRELEERNRELESQSLELERSYRLQSQFLASMSHELRTPINSLLGYTSLLRDRIYGDMTEPQMEAMDRMYLASRHLLELVDDILDLAKIEAGKMPVHVDRFEIPELLRELSLTVEPMVRRSGLELRVDVAPGLAPITSDRKKVKQILLNLLSNAVKFTAEGHVHVLAEASDGGPEGASSVVIHVTDTGIGMDEADLRTIFDDFRQLDGTHTRRHGGTGLGLSITRKLLHLLGGSIDVRSVPGKGSTFTVRLPTRSEPLLVEDDAAATGIRTEEAV